jgi:hypothetical protein
MLSYKTKGDLEQLVKDWTCSALITMDGVGIPLGLWKKLYKRTRPSAWERLKDQWTKFKFIVGGFKSFETADEFWNAMSLSPTMAEHKIINYRKISDCLRKMRSERDIEDTKAARASCNEKEFQRQFSYRKGGQSHVMSKPHDVARRYRLQIRQPVYWDEEESEEE